MKGLLRFLNQYKNGVVFLVLELISLFLVFNGQSLQLTKQLHCTPYWVGKLYAYIADLKAYPLIKKDYQALLDENSALRAQLVQKEIASNISPDIAIEEPYHFIPAKVINNSIIHAKNYLTIDKGAQHGITPGMGVMTTQGIVGRVKSVTDHFSTITSLLHIDMLVSAKVGKVGAIATVHWLGDNPTQAQLLYVPRHVKIEPGDAVVTSGYNATFYEGISIGRVKQVELKKEAPFYNITVELSTDFSTLQHVYVIKNKSIQEREALEKYTKSYDK
jgi:rod shape-determining protein MreC